MPKNRNTSVLSEKDIEKARESFENQLDSLGFNPFSKLKTVKAAKNYIKALKQSMTMLRKTSSIIGVVLRVVLLIAVLIY